MLQTLKVGVFRSVYRFSARRAWHAPDVHSSPGALELPTTAGPLRGHLYRGAHAGERPMVIYFHGGGWVIGDLQTHHAYCQALCDASGATVLAVDYRLAPEHRFPTAQDDCLAAAQAIFEGLADFGPSNGGVVLAGDSAGGHLSLCTALAAGNDLRQAIKGLLLTYPVVDHYTRPSPSYVDCAKGQTLTSDIMRWFWDSYLGDQDPESEETQRAFPIRSAALATLPPAILCTAGRDPLRDEGMAIADAMRDAGVAVEQEHYPDSEHNFACTMGPTEDYKAWLRRCADWIAQR
ncbi:alpha/beta hydrolase [Congregibacter sp.]|uniref:alpha/beta hydrolase n=1 Tax=Congregibacter sp. TaxID=2744308 RepID=UPI003F6BA224